MIKYTEQQFIDAVIDYEANGCNIENYEAMTDKQHEAIACALRDMKIAEEAHGDENADDYCAEAYDAIKAYYQDFRKSTVTLAEGGFCEPENAAEINSGCGTKSIHHIDLIANYMDDEIREQVHHELAPCTAQEFVDRYCKLHKEKFGEDFCIN